MDYLEADEARLASFELPAEVPATGELARAVHCSIAWRTIITAARSGKLRQLVCDGEMKAPFAIPALVPYWVAVEKWGGVGQYGSDYHRNATSLRQVLAHLSLSRASSDGLLTWQDVQALHTVDDSEWTGAETGSMGIYAAWFREDAVLAQQVADAWNAVVERGEADEVWCLCHQCREIRDTRRVDEEPQYDWY